MIESKKTLEKVVDDATRVRPILLIAIYVALALVFVIGLAQIPSIIYRYIPPYEVVSAKLVEDSDSTDSSISIRYHVIRRRICLTDLDRFARTIPDGNVVWRDRVPGGAVPVGDSTVVNVIHIPGHIKPGIYELQTTIISQCPEGMHTTTTPTVRFEITPPAGLR